jgi:hypothetical protein
MKTIYSAIFSRIFPLCFSPLFLVSFATNFSSHRIAKKEENDENMNRTLIDLPADDRLHKTRKIMHKDLHKH